MEKHSNLIFAWLEAFVPWQKTIQWGTISDALETSTLTGEDINHKLNFKELINKRAVDIVRPDPGSQGGYLQAKLMEIWLKKMKWEWPCIIHLLRLHLGEPLTR